MKKKEEKEEPKSIGLCHCGLPLNKHYDRDGELWLACPKHGRLTEDIDATVKQVEEVQADLRGDVQTAPASPDPGALLRGEMEGLVRIANRHGFFLEARVSDGHRILRRSDGESLELLLEEA